MRVGEVEKIGGAADGSKESTALARAESTGLTVRSAALVLRGLRDLARDSNWLVKKVFAGHSKRVAISDTGLVCAIPNAGSGAAQRLVVYDMESNAAALTLTMPDEAAASAAVGLKAALAWSAGSRFLVAAWDGWRISALHIFDLHAKALAGTFGAFTNFPGRLGWSGGGKHFAAASSGGKNASLRIWSAGDGPVPCSALPQHEIGLPEGFERQTYEAEFGEEGAFAGYGSLAFSPDERTLAGVAEIRGDWADDSIVLVDAATLAKKGVFNGQGHITDLSWTADSRQILYCAGGQAYRLEISKEDAELLPFGAELCACHPRLPLCLCFSSWLKNSAKGRLFVVDLNSLEILDEHAAENIADLRWNSDGSKAYAVTSDGMGYVYEPPAI
jgi:hypothetical protein